MARLDGKGKYVPNKKIKVSQLVVDTMRKVGMKKALERANSGEASEEEVEGARRFYGSRVTGKAKKDVSSSMTKSLAGTQSPTVTKTAARPQGHVIAEKKATPTVSRKAAPKGYA